MPGSSSRYGGRTMISRSVVWFWWLAEYGWLGMDEEDMRRGFGMIEDSALAWAFGLEVIRRGWFSR